MLDTVTTIVLLLMVVACLFQQDRTNAGLAQSQQDKGFVQNLGQERTRLFKIAQTKPNSGYFYGQEGSWHDIYFPIGKSSPMYFEAYVIGGKYEAAVREKVVSVIALSPYVITCWRKTNKGVRKVWQHWFIVKNNDPNNVVKVVNKKDKSWRAAKAFTQSRAPFVVYHFGQHGDIELQRRCEFHNMESSENDRKPYPSPQNLTVPNGEIRFMREHNLFPKQKK